MSTPKENGADAGRWWWGGCQRFVVTGNCADCGCKAAIKREQSQTSLSYAEREQARSGIFAAAKLLIFLEVSKDVHEVIGCGDLVIGNEFARNALPAVLSTCAKTGYGNCYCIE